VAVEMLTPHAHQYAESEQLQAWRIWGPVVCGVLLLYIPTYLRLVKVSWSNESGAQGPIFLAIALWLGWRQRALLSNALRATTASNAGWVFVAAAAVMYVVGRSQQFIQFEVGSQVPLLLGVALILLGRTATKELWFPILFLLSLVPIPGSTVDFLLLPLKTAVSSIVANGLFSLGLPVAKDGVMIYAGPYQLLVANACSGLNSMIALTVVGILYVHLSSHKTMSRNILLLASVLPIAFFANLLRVTCIVIATLKVGDESGRYVHAYAAYAEILVAFGAFLLLDHLISFFWRVPDAAGR
jgi:exosortase B